MKISLSSWKKDQQKSIHPLLDKEKQEQAKLYEKEKRLLGLFSTLLSLAVLLVLYFFGLSAWLARLFPDKPVFWVFLFYVFIFQTLLLLVHFPLSFYRGYVHEHKWNFSNQTLTSWLWEQVKAYWLGLALFEILLGLLFWIMSSYPHYWWVIAGLASALVSIVLAVIFPVVILPIFNKYTPIEDENLTSSLNKILTKGGLNSSGFFKEDMSRQTKKENAFLAGLGRSRRVVLGDNLLANMTVAEIESIIAHEVGHFTYKHIWKHIILGTIQHLFVFLILHLVMTMFFPFFLASTRWNLTYLPLLIIVTGALSGILLGPVSHYISRHFERQADTYALAAINDKRAFMTALAGLADRNLSNAYPEWWVKLLYYSHPPIGERLILSEEWTALP